MVVPIQFDQATRRRVTSFGWIGVVRTHWQCIEFLKTVGWRPRDRHDDELDTFEGLVRWAERQGVLSGRAVDEVLSLASRRPVDADRALAEARRVRDLIYRILSRTALDVPTDAGHVDELNRMLKDAFPLRRLSNGARGFEWIWTTDPHRLDGLLASVVWSTAELLTAPEADRLRLCDADDCGWLFIDGSRNRSRRWCDMSDCGNRAKVRAFRARRAPGGG